MLDVGATVDGYGSDMTRMFAIEFADDKNERYMRLSAEHSRQAAKPLRWENHAVK